MPVIVVGADTLVGVEVIEELVRNTGEVRAFISNLDFAETFRDQNCKVAIGDVSDGSHIELAGFEAFTAVLIAEAAVDGRERSFSSTPEETAVTWINAVVDAGIQRVIWIGTPPLDDPPERDRVPEMAVLHQSDSGTAAEVGRLNELAELP